MIIDDEPAGRALELDTVTRLIDHGVSNMASVNHIDAASSLQRVVVARRTGGGCV